MDLTIDRDDEAVDAADALVWIKDRLARIADLTTPVVAAAKDAYDAALAQRKELRQPFEDADKRLRLALTAWETRKAEAAAAEQTRLDAEVNTTGTGDEEVPVIVHVAPTPSALPTRAFWVWTVTDLQALAGAVASGVAPPDLLAVNSAAMRREVARYEGQLPYPGVAVAKELRPVVR